MKLPLIGSLVLVVAAALTTGCGPGLSHRAKAPSDDVFQKMDAELANAIGTTTLTGAELPSSRMSLAEAAGPAEALEAEAPVTVVQTWATPAPAVDPPALYDPGAAF